MKSISLKHLKEHLSEYTEAAALGTTIQVTKYNRPFIYLLGVQSPALHVGTKAGTGELRSVGNQASHGAFLKVLKEDRDG